MKWLKSVYPDGPLEYAIPDEESIERVTACWWGFPKRTADSVSIFCDSTRREIEITFKLPSSNGSVPKAEALLTILQGGELLYAKKSTQTDHEELAYMLKFLGLFCIMCCFEENYFDELRRLEKRVTDVKKYYASLK